ncbi:MAG: hypothetical protein ACTSQ5_04685 [Promethearchaeota archaeon]
MIEWNKVNEKPDKTYKVLGQNLLDQRNKINDLESNLQTTSSELNAARTRQDQANSKIAGYEKEISGLEERANKYDALVTEHATLQEQFTNASQELSQLKGQIAQITQTIEDTTGKITELSNANMDLTKKLEFSNAQAGEFNTKMLEAQKQADELSKQLIGLKELNTQLTAKVTDLEQSSSKVHELEQKITQQESVLKQKAQAADEFEAKLKELEPPVPDVSSYELDARVTCPMCAGTEIKDVEDKTKVLSYVGHMPMYARKHACKKCGYEWQ